MKFEYIRKTDIPLMEYGYMLSTGDVVDLPEHLAKKALNRPLDYKLAAWSESPSHEEMESEDKPRRGRPPLPKVKDGDES